jgi:hypothetical protein
MLTLPLDPTDDRANPAFKDATACAKWLGQLQLTNLHQAHSVLHLQLDELNRYPMRALERMHMLELLRETVSSLQSDYGRKLVAKKLPLHPDEFTTFVAIVGLWQSMVTGYQRCLQACMTGEAQLAAYGALLCQRCLQYSGLQIFEHLRNGYDFDSKLWGQLHQLYAFCEEQEWQLSEVKDDMHGQNRTTTCNATYTKSLLACHAHRADLSRHQLQLTDRWLTLWSPSVAVSRQFIPSKGDAPPLVVDLSSATGLQLPQGIPVSEHLRYLTTVPLSKLIRVKNILLQQGQTPSQLELGEGCHADECIVLLNYLHQCWCDGYDGRISQRRAALQQAQVCYGMDSCFAYIANRPFKQPAKDTAIDTLSRKQIAAFGRVLSETNRHDLTLLGMVLEDWLIEDESIRGARMIREENVGTRIGTGQLVAVRPTNANAFMVGAMTWVTVTLTGQLRVGVRYLPGLPNAIALKATGVNLTVSDKYVAALMLPAVPVLKTPASLIAPRDWFKAGRVVEVVQGDTRKVHLKLELSIEKGLDYERISFTELEYKQ